MKKSTAVLTFIAGASFGIAIPLILISLLFMNTDEESYKKSIAWLEQRLNESISEDTPDGYERAAKLRDELKRVKDEYEKKFGTKGINR